MTNEEASSENDENAHPNVPPPEPKSSRYQRKESSKKEEVVVVSTPAPKEVHKKPEAEPQESKVDNAYLDWLKLVVSRILLFKDTGPNLFGICN